MGGAFAPPADAVPIELTLVDVPAGSEIGQTGDDPCVIGDNSCTNNQPAGVDWTLIGVSSGSWDLMSPEYTIGQLESALGPGGSIVAVGIDVNKNANSLETLDYFQIVIGGMVEYYFGSVGPGPTGSDDAGPSLANAVDLANGTGFSDWLLNSFDLSLYQDATTIKFFAGLDNTGGGKEQFFLTNDFGNPPPPPTIPEPSTLLLFGTGLTVLGVRLRGRTRRS